MTLLLVAVDGSDHSLKALDLAAGFAKGEGARVIVLHVVPFEPVPTALKEYARVEHMRAEDLEVSWHQGREIGDNIVAEAERRLRGKDVGDVGTIVVEGRPAEVIVATAEDHGADMIFMGSRGLSDAKGLLLGSTSHKVAHLAPCTCVAVK